MQRDILLRAAWMAAIGLAACCPNGAVAEPPRVKESAAEAEAPLYEYKKQHDPNGIGKFYMGREIAHVMGFQAAPWLERTEREQEERLSLMVSLLGIKPGTTVADIGAGSGVITLMMAERVGPKGRVLAVDIQDEMLSLLDKKLKQLKVENVGLVLSTAKSPKLKPESVDLALMVDVYHEFEFPYEMMKDLTAAIRPGGRIVFVEYRKEDPAVPIKEVHKMSEAQVKREMSRPEFGMKWKETIGKLPIQHMVVFEKPAAKAETPK